MSLALSDSLPIARYRFTLRTEAPLMVAEYPGSMLRGAFGHGLKSVSCLTDLPHCSECPMRDACRYPALFEPRPGPEQSRFPDIPAPYILEADNHQNRQLAAGKSWSFHMVLFGSAIDQLPVIIMAWQRAATQGLGKGKARCRLEQVEWLAPNGDAQTIFHEHSPRVVPHEAHLSIPALTSRHEVTMELLSPTRIQSGGKLRQGSELTGPIVLHALARKIELYAGSYWGAMWKRPAIPEDLELTQATRMQQWQRYSSRQRQAMSLNGLVGTLRLSGSLDQWLPWLWLGQYTHLGKNTSFGLGQYRLETTDDTARQSSEVMAGECTTS